MSNLRSQDIPAQTIWKERMLRCLQSLFSFSLAMRYPALNWVSATRRLKSQSKMEAECPLCHHVICNDLCQELQQKREVLTVWKRLAGILPALSNREDAEDDSKLETWTEEDEDAGMVHFNPSLAFGVKGMGEGRGGGILVFSLQLLN
eukprot:3568758-Rhodomonas_salina.1